MPSQRPGFATITTTLILGIAFAFAVVLVDTVLTGRQAGKTLQETLLAAQIAEAGVHKAIFCLNSIDNSKCGGVAGSNYPGETNVSFGGGSFTTTLVSAGPVKTVTSVGTARSGRVRTLTTELTSIPPEDSPSFSYALQTGTGGAHLENNSTITGTIYSNGDIDCQTTQADILGDAYTSKADGFVSACNVGYHAHADRILNSVLGGDAYYRTHPDDIAGTTVGGVSYAGSTRPAVAPMPELDLNFWRTESENGGIIYGDYAPADNTTLGPVKIVGNLIMNNNIDVTLTGPIWVVGNITTGNNSSFTLDSAFGAYSTTILADNPADNTQGKILITNNTGINGSGDSRSHILFASTCNKTSDVDPALSVANNAAGAVFYAINGTLRLESNAGAKSLAGYRLFLDQNAVVTYVESDFTGSFSSSPGGTWRIKEGTWRDF